MLCVRQSLLLCINRFKLCAIRSCSRRAGIFTSREMMSTESDKSADGSQSADRSAEPTSAPSEVAESGVASNADSKQSDESGHVEIREGRAKILFPSSNEVFYNPVQEFNRDLR